MSIKSFKPTTPSRRQMTVSGFDGVDKKAKPFKDVLLVRGARHGALGDDGANDDIIRDHYAYTSSMVARAAWSMTRYLALTRS